MAVELGNPEVNAVAFPGQGSQFVRMGADLAEHYPSVRHRFEQADRALGYRISEICFKGPEEILNQTDNTQVGLEVYSVACQEVLEEEEIAGYSRTDSVLGNSIGEYAALFVAGSISFEEMIRLAQIRGRKMHKACVATPSGLLAVFTDTKDMDRLAGVFEDVNSKVTTGRKVDITNINNDTQALAGSDNETLAEAAKIFKSDHGIRTIPVKNIAGAFHSWVMKLAQEGLNRAIEGARIDDPLLRIIGNTTARPLRTALEVREELKKQLVSTVLLNQSIKYLAAEGVVNFICPGESQITSNIIEKLFAGSVQEPLKTKEGIVIANCVTLPQDA